MQQRSLLGVLRWTLLSLGAVFALVLQQSAFSRLPVWGAVPSLVPVAVALVALWEGPEAGGLFALCAGIVWFLSGERYGPMYIFLLPLSAVLVGVICRDYLSRTLLSALLMTMGTLLLCEGAVLLLQLYLGTGRPLVFLVMLGYSLCFVFPFYPIVRLVEKLGGT